MPALVHILQQSQNTAVRQLAAVEARKLTPKMWNDSFAPQIRGTILDSTLAEQDPKTRHASARLISAIAKMDMKDGKSSTLRTGAVAIMPANGIHQFTCLQACTIFIHSNVAFDIHYVDKTGKEITPAAAIKAVKETVATEMK